MPLSFSTILNFVFFTLLYLWAIKDKLFTLSWESLRFARISWLRGILFNLLLILSWQYESFIWWQVCYYFSWVLFLFLSFFNWGYFLMLLILNLNYVNSVLRSARVGIRRHFFWVIGNLPVTSWVLLTLRSLLINASASSNKTLWCWFQCWARL